ncbi:MAG: hypothetical protein KDD69_04305 [Bdellovibrionales bacterium]|nr:hypothetical protein [Bdellovibrionales bacterium]
MARETFLSYRSYVWFWLCFFALLAMTVVYLLDDPIGGKNGGTIVGYTYGGIATAGILFLMWYGIRKRAYFSARTTLKGILSAHVWIGIALIFVVPLHSGFSFGINVHTLAYVLMLLTIFSGIWGVAMYQRLPYEIQSQRGGGTLKVLMEQVRSISADINRMAASDGGKGAPKSDAFLRMLQQLDFVYQPSLWRSLRRKNPEPIERRSMADSLSSLPIEEQEDGLKLIGLLNKKRELVGRAQEEARALTWVRIWLYLHLPVSFGLIAALAVHIFSVFFYW